jgi:hypothetical protein
MKRFAIPLAIVALAGSAAWADEVTTTTTTRSAPQTEVTIEKSAPATVEHKEVTTGSVSDCQSKTVHKENDAGESKTVHKETCD